MDVADVMEEMAEKLETVTGVEVYAYPPGKPDFPCMIVGLPDEITFDQTYGRGSDSMTFPVWVLVSLGDIDAATTKLVKYLAGGSGKSVKAALDSNNTNEYTSCDTVTATTAVPGSYTYNGHEVLGAEFTVMITGSGS